MGPVADNALTGEGALPAAVGGVPSLTELAAIAEELGPERWRTLSDAAQVVASYLACHPRVAAVRYCGLKADPDFAEAACTLRGGFGPVVCVRLVGDAPGTWRRWEPDGRDVREQVMELEGLLARR